MKRYRISEFAAMVGLSQSKIRFYEKYGLFEVKRSRNGYRYYTPEDASRWSGPSRCWTKNRREKYS